MTDKTNESFEVLPIDRQATYAPDALPRGEASILQAFQDELTELAAQANLRQLHRYPIRGVNLSSNDYLALASNTDLKQLFLSHLTPESFLPTSSSSRLLTGNHETYYTLEKLLADLYGTEAALVFNSGYHTNIGILQAVSNTHTLILADKLVHASLIDGIRLSQARCIRFRHANYEQLASLLATHHRAYERIIVVTESIFSMDGDEADLKLLVGLKRQYTNVLLYVDEAHAVGVRGVSGLGCAQAQNCIADIDFLVGTFGKALASLGGYLVCKKQIREYLINKMRTLIFTTALPPVNLMWTQFVMERLASFSDKRRHLEAISAGLREALSAKGYTSPSSSHIIPIMAGRSQRATTLAMQLQRNGFHVLPVRPPTVPEGTSRIRISLTADISEQQLAQFIDAL